MTNEELKKKIESIIRNAKRDFAYCVPEEWAVKVLADALIAAGIGDIKETEHRTEVTEKSFKKYLEKEACRFCNYKKINYCEATKESQEDCFNATVETYIKQAEKELAEKGKDEN